MAKDEGFESAQPYGGDVGGDSVSRDEAWFANVKRTYDEYQDLALERARSNNAAHDLTVQSAAQANAVAMQAAAQGFTALVKGFQDLVGQAAALNEVVVRGAQNAETADHLGSLQAYAHRDIAIDEQWNDGPVGDATVAEGADNIVNGDDD